jgi:Na+/proline symporter
MQIYSVFEGLFLILGYGAIMWMLTAFFAGRFLRSKVAFLAADREVGKWPMGFSIAATWIWAPALFVAAQKGYTQGIVGVFWFTVPNVACLLIFSYFAGLIRKKHPNGFTLSDYIRQRHSNRVHNLYLLQMIGLAACSFAVQLLAGAVVVSSLTGIPFFWVTLMLSFIALSYSWFSGMKASVITDYAQMIFIAAIGFVFVPWVIGKAGGFSTVWAGIGGASGTFTNLFTGDGLKASIAFGIPVTVGLLSGPFGDQTFWQRAYSTRETEVKAAFIRGAFIFATVPILMSLLGFIAAGAGLQISDTQLVNLKTVMEYLPIWTVAPFTYMLLSGLVSTLDSNICAISSLAGHDVLNRMNRKEGGEVVFARKVMIGFCVGALLIANIPGMKILYLFLFYGTLRASTLLPTIITLLNDRVSERGMFWGISGSIAIGLPIFAYGKFTGSVGMIVFGSLFTVLFSGGVVWLRTAYRDVALKRI